MPTTPDDVLRFWFGDAPAATAPDLQNRFRRWFMGGPSLDAEIVARFGEAIDAAVEGGLREWEGSPDGTLALIVLLDQFTRSAYRDQARMYAGDPRAQRLAVAALDRGIDAGWDTERKQFLRMPLVHAEDLGLQQRSAAETDGVIMGAPEHLRPLFSMGREQTRKYLDIVGRFGRFPHRNAILGRTSTAEEVEFLEEWADRMPPSGMKDAAKP